MPAALRKLQRLQKVLRALIEGRVHEDQVIALLRLKGQEIVMHHAEALAFHRLAEHRVDLDAVDVGLFQRFALGVFVIDRKAPAGVIHLVGRNAGKVALASAWLQHALDEIPVDALHQSIGQRFGGGVNGLCPCGEG